MTREAERELKALRTVVGWTLALVVLIPVTLILHGWVVTILWGWFAVEVFGAPPLGLWAAIGLATLYGMLKTHIYPKEQDHAMAVGALFLHPFLALFFGWLAHLLMETT